MRFKEYSSRGTSEDQNQEDQEEEKDQDQDERKLTELVDSQCCSALVKKVTALPPSLKIVKTSDATTTVKQFLF